MKIIYFISVILLFASFILLKKNEEKLNFIKSLVISIVIFLCYNMFICYVYSSINIPINLLTLSFINLAIELIFLSFIIKNKTQKYYINKKDILAVSIIILTTIIFTIINLGENLNIKYITTDAAIHYTAAKDFYNNETLLDKVDDTSIAKQFMIGTYVNTGILFKVVNPFIGEMDLYKVFIIFDAFMFCIMGMLIYTAVEKIINKKLNYIITLLMILFFMAGYPLNSFIYGYVYLQLGIIIIASIINVLQYFSEIFNKKILYGILFLFNFALFFTYCIFVPVIYIVEFIYLIKKKRKEGKLLTKKNLAILLIVFIIPSICGLLFFVLPHLYNTNSDEVFINIEGYIYRNCWANFIFILPLALMCTKQKNDDTYIWLIFTNILIIFMILFFVVIRKFDLSTYYYYKFNYILWFILWYGAIYAINVTERKLKIILTIYIMAYMLIGGIITINKDVEITKETYDEDENITNAFDIYILNKKVLIDEREDYNKKELELLEYIYENINLKDSSMLLIVSPRQAEWFNAFFNYKNRDDLQLVIPVEDIIKWNNKGYEYLLLLYRNDFYEQYKEIINKRKSHNRK